MMVLWIQLKHNNTVSPRQFRRGVHDKKKRDLLEYNPRTQARRALKTRFPNTDPIVFETSIDANGNNVEDVVMRKIDDCSKSNKYIKAEFWTFIANIYSLSSSDWDDLLALEDHISETDPFDKDLPHIVNSISSDNPAIRSQWLDRLESHLQNCAKLPLRQVYALLMDCRQGLKLTRNQTFKYQFSVLRYIANHGVAKTWPYLMDSIGTKLEQVCLQKWESMVAQTSRTTFVWNSTGKLRFSWKLLLWTSACALRTMSWPQTKERSTQSPGTHWVRHYLSLKQRMQCGIMLRRK